MSGRIHLDDVAVMLGRGDRINDVAAQLDVHPDSIYRAGWKRGTPEQRAAIARARRANLEDAWAGTRTRTAASRQLPTRRTA